MKFNYHVPASTYTRTSHYTPTYQTPSQYTPSQYTPTQYKSSYTSPTKYSSTQYTPSQYTSTSYKSSPTYIPSYSSEPRYTASRRAQAKITPTPVKRAVHFPNDIIFQDNVRRGDLEQIGRFMRARKVRVDTIFLSGMAALHEAVLTGNLEVVKLLVKYGADVHQRDEDGWTPLHMACSDGYPEIASSSAPRMVNSYKRTSSPRSPTNSGELFTPAHEENVRFIHETWQCVLRDIRTSQNNERNDRGPQEYVEKNPNPNLHSFTPVDLSDLKKRNTQDTKKS